LKITSGNCTLKKDDGNLVGISIGGGAPLCPCLYIVQVFDNTPASRDGSLAAGMNLALFFPANNDIKTLNTIHIF
jgi:hypothetical protein